jgi:hypothetical protein
MTIPKHEVTPPLRVVPAKQKQKANLQPEQRFSPQAEMFAAWIVDRTSKVSAGQTHALVFTVRAVG